jgi:hypothetical protein
MQRRNSSRSPSNSGGTAMLLCWLVSAGGGATVWSVWGRQSEGIESLDLSISPLLLLFFIGPIRANFFPTCYSLSNFILVHLYQFGPVEICARMGYPDYLFLFFHHYILINFHPYTNYCLANITQLFHNFPKCSTIFLAFSIVFFEPNWQELCPSLR